MAACRMPELTLAQGERPPAAIWSDDLAAARGELAAGETERALERVTIALSRAPGDAQALALFGQIAISMEKPGLALLPLQRAVGLDPRLEHRIWLALCLAKLEIRDDALRVMQEATRTMPPSASAHFAAGMVYYALDQYAEAARCYADCIALDASRSAAHHRYARALHAAGEIESSVEAYQAAMRRCAVEADYHADLSGALADLGRFEEARAAAAEAVRLDPACIVGQNNLGHALLSLNRSAEALCAYEAAIAASPTYAKAQFGYASALLKSGDFARGWPQYEWRWRDSQTPRADLSVPLWQGEAIEGQAILLHAEQGFGDSLQFVRFAPLIAERGGCVVLEVPKPLARLLRGVEGVSEVIVRGDPLPPVDWHCPMASLPMAFGLRLDSIPAAPYLPRPVGSSPQPALTVGLVWAGDPRPWQPSAHRVDQRRSMRLVDLSPLMDIDGVRFVSFQMGAARGQLASGGQPIVDMMKGVEDFLDTAERLAGVDLLISVDTAMVHLAGAIGMPVWMLSRFDGCWRWLEGRADSPWYPNLRIFRQRTPGDWAGLVTEVRAALRQFSAQRAG